MKWVLVVGMLLFAVPLMAQDEQETLFGENSKVEFGGFGAPVAKFTKINGKLGVLAGARAGWIINHVLSLGVGGYYLVNNVRADALGPRNDPYVNLFYGGLEMELIAASNSLMHFSLHSLVGAGGIGTRFALFSERDRYRQEMIGYRYGYDNDYHHHHHFGNDGWWRSANGVDDQVSSTSTADVTPLAGRSRIDGFFVVEPGANLDFNMTESFRLSLGGSYRWVKGVRSTASTNKQLTGPSLMVTFRFGKF